MSSSAGISAVIITKNEERNIGRCLDSLADVADEIIVIDSFSTDGTPGICRSRNVIFRQQAWMGYSETKNFGIAMATMPYILSIDADEALSEALRNDLLKLKHGSFSYDAFRVKRLTNYCGKWIYHCGWYPDYKIRLWKKETGKWRGRIHEKVELEAGSTVGKLTGDLLHYSYYSINEHLQQMIQFTDLMAEDLYLKKKSVGLLKVIMGPLIKFLNSYFLKAGFRDGFYGFIICMLSGVATFLKYAKTYELNRNSDRQDR